MQQFLKSAAGQAGTRVIPTQLLEELLVTADDPNAAFDACLGREALASFTCDLESTRRRGVRV